MLEQKHAPELEKLERETKTKRSNGDALEKKDNQTLSPLVVGPYNNMHTFADIRLLFRISSQSVSFLTENTSSKEKIAFGFFRPTSTAPDTTDVLCYGGIFIIVQQYKPS